MCGRGCCCPERRFLSPDDVAHPRPVCERIRLRLSPLWCGSFASLPLASPAALLTSFGSISSGTHTCAFRSPGTILIKTPTSDRLHCQNSSSSSCLPSFYLSSWTIEFKCHQLETKVDICNEGQGACGLARWWERLGWSRGRGCLRGRHVRGGEKLTGTAAWQEAVVVAMGDSSVVRIDPATNYIEDNGNRFLIVSYL